MSESPEVKEEILQESPTKTKRQRKPRVLDGQGEVSEESKKPRKPRPSKKD
jgi:hypothetical protein